MFVGIFELGATVRFLHQSVGSTNQPTSPTGNPTYRVYELPSETPLATGNGSAFDAINITGVSLIAFTAASGSGFERGRSYSVHVVDVVAGVTKAKVYVSQVS